MIRRKTVRILGVKIDCLTRRAALEVLEDLIASRARHQVCVTNVWTTVLMQRDPWFKSINNSASLVVADGMPLAWVSKWFGASIPVRIAGWDLFQGFLTIAEKKGYRVFFLGSSPSTLEAMKSNLSRTHPGLALVGTYAPPFTPEFSPDENRRMVEAVNAARPDLLWVGLSAPKQEKWIFAHLNQLEVPVAIGVGAVFDFAAGKLKRAPLWMQKAGIEWLHRLLLEPSRLWKRYIVGNSLFVWYIIRYALASKLKPKKYSRS
jgi:N-acetylglucosaminyldiphosphoundecaprenol N-acetyl-beta-D-mannosaminyltransferase